MSGVQTESGVNISMEVDQLASEVIPPITRAIVVPSWSYWLTRGEEETGLVTERVAKRRKSMTLSRIMVTVLPVLVVGLV